MRMFNETNGVYLDDSDVLEMIGITDLLEQDVIIEPEDNEDDE